MEELKKIDSDAAEIIEANYPKEGKRGGTIVTHNTSKLIGITKNTDAAVDGKILVYTRAGKMLCKPENLTVSGFYDRRY